MTRRLLAPALLAALVCAPLAAQAKEAEKLKAAFDEAVRNFNGRRLEAFAQSFHPQVATFDGAPFARESLSERIADFEVLFATSESARFIPINPKFRVIEDTGVAWGHWALALKPKDGPARTTYGRYTLTFAKSGRKWLVVSEHFSPIPSD